MREGSYGTRTLIIVLNSIKGYKAETLLLDLRATKMPIFNPSSSNSSATDTEIQKITELVNWADAFILASPDYHGSMSGTMKNFLDHYWEEFAGKTFGYICTSHEKEDCNEEGEIINELLDKRLKILARDLVIYGKLIRGQFLQDISSNVSDTFAARYSDNYSF
jgi:multimeric flavodoxin WrbA